MLFACCSSSRRFDVLISFFSFFCFCFFFFFFSCFFGANQLSLSCSFFSYSSHSTRLNPSNKHASNPTRITQLLSKQARKQASKQTNSTYVIHFLKHTHTHTNTQNETSKESRPNNSYLFSTQEFEANSARFQHSSC
jgi:hypothetical protein